MTQQNASQSRSWKARLFGAGIVLGIPVAGLAYLCTVLYLTKMAWSNVFSANFSIAQLGAFGDSLAPLTVLFAFVAAFYAHKAYRAQTAALTVEKERDERARFDSLFTEALDLYDKAFEQLDTAARKRKQDKGASATESTCAAPDTEDRSALIAKRTGQGLLDAVRKLEKVNTGAVSKINFWISKLRTTDYHPVQRFALTVFALVVWLEDGARATKASEHRSLRHWMRLFEARLSGPERDALTILLKHWATDKERASAAALGLFGSTTTTEEQIRAG